MSASYTSLQRSFRSNPKINPETGRTIKKGSKTYDELVTRYGEPIKHRKSPAGAARSRSPPATRRSPTKTVTTVKTTRSPGRVIRTVKTTRSNSSSPVRTYRSLSPKRTLAKSSPARLNKSKDIFTVLSESSVITTYNKLDNNYKQEWVAHSPYVREIVMKHQL